MDNSKLPAFAGPAPKRAEWAGLNKREYIAAMAMQGIISHYGVCHANNRVSEDAVKQADALLKELEQ